ncbi:hypothetical protein ACT691_17360 [Vibrio metschnikovii]
MKQLVQRLVEVQRSLPAIKTERQLPGDFDRTRIRLIDQALNAHLDNMNRMLKVLTEQEQIQLETALKKNSASRIKTEIAELIEKVRK